MNYYIITLLHKKKSEMYISPKEIILYIIYIIIISPQVSPKIVHFWRSLSEVFEMKNGVNGVN